MNKEIVLHKWLSVNYPNITKEVSSELYDWIKDYDYDFNEVEGELSWIDLQQLDEPIIYFTQDRFIKYWIDTIYPKMFASEVEVGDEWFEFIVELNKLYYGKNINSNHFRKWLEVTEKYKDWKLI